MKLFTLCAFALTLAIAGMVMAGSDSEQRSGIERGSDVEYRDENTTKHPHHKHRTTHKQHYKKKTTKHYPRYPTKDSELYTTSSPPFSPDNDFTLEPDTSTTDFGNDTSSSSSSSSPFSNDTTTDNPYTDDTTTENPFNNHTTTRKPFHNDTTTGKPFNNDTTRYHPTYKTSTSPNPNRGESCELFSIKEKSFVSRLDYFKSDLEKNYERTSKHNAHFYKAIYVRKCTYHQKQEFGFNIHYLLQVSACLKDEVPTAEKNCTTLPSTVARCEADLIANEAIYHGCELDNLEKSNSGA